MTTTTGTPAPAAGEAATPTPAPAGDATPTPAASTATPPAPTPQQGGSGNGGADPVTPLGGGESQQASPSAPSSEQQPSANPPDYSTLTLPEGMPEGHLDNVRAYAQQLGLTVEHAQAMADRDAQILHAQRAEARAAVQERIAEWQGEIQADTNLGGLKWPNTQVRMQTVLTRFDPKGELRGVLEQSGYLHHPAVVRVLAGIGQAMEPGQVAPGGPPAPAPKTTAERMYPNAGT